MQKINPFLWFDTQAEEAVYFYTSIFKDSRKGHVTYYNESFPDKRGQVMTVNFELFGQDFIALNGGPQFRFSPAISLFIHCDSQQEVDELWAKLTDGGKPGHCGWLEDRFGVTWQVVPDEMFSFFDADPKTAQAVTQSMLTMRKIDLNELKRAAELVS